MVDTNKSLFTRPQLLIDLDLIIDVGSFNYLGVYIDTRQIYKVQIEYTKSKLN